MPEPEGLTNAAKARLEYWRHLDSRLEERGFAPHLIVPAPDSSLSLSLGDTGEAEFVLSFNQGRGQIHVSLILSGKLGERLARGLEKDKAAIHQGLGYHLTWELSNNGGEIYITDEGIPIRDQNDWPVQHDWFGDRLEDFQRVLQPRVIALEKEALNDPELRQALEQRGLLANYWRACVAALVGSSLAFRNNDPNAGRMYCRFERLDAGVNLGAQYSHDESYICIYFSVSSAATRKQRSAFKDLMENHFTQLESEIGQTLKWNEPYFWVSIPGNINDHADWPRQHNWVRDTAEKFVAVFKPRLGIE